MAFLDNSSDVQSQTQGQGSQGQTAQGAGDAQGAAPTVSGAGGSDVGGVSTAGVGNGGTGGWTNIQAYLNANQGNTGSADNLNKTVGGQFDTENKNLNTQAQQAGSSADNQVSQNNITNDQANNLIQDAGGQYNWNGDQSTGYNNDVNKVNSALTSKWQGPSDFSYGLTGQSQNYGNSLNNDQGFQSLLGGIYSNMAGSPLSTGQQSLQGQLDVNNSALASARSNLQNQYQNLQNNVQDTSAKTSNQIQNDRNAFATNQANLNSYLNDQGNAYNGTIGQKETDATNAYNTAYNGNSNIGNANADVEQAIAGLHSTDPSFALNFVKDPGNTWSSLNSYLQNQRTAGNQTGAYTDIQSGIDKFNTDAQAKLEDFQRQQAAQLGTTAAPEKADWNAIQDFLNSGATKQGQTYNYFGNNPQVMTSNPTLGQQPIGGPLRGSNILDPSDVPYYYSTGG